MVHKYDKEYYERSKEKILNQSKKWYNENKAEYYSKIQCECGCMIQKPTLKRHQRSKKHLKLMAAKLLII